MLLSRRVYKFLLCLMRAISLSYLVSWFLSFNSGDERLIFTIEESSSFSKRLSKISLPNLQLFRTNSFILARELTRVGSTRLLLRLTV